MLCSAVLRIYLGGYILFLILIKLGVLELRALELTFHKRRNLLRSTSQQVETLESLRIEDMEGDF